MIRAVIFDADGTLLDSMHIWDELASRFLLSCGVSVPDGLNDTLASMSFDEGCEYLHTNYLPSSSTGEIKQGMTVVLERFYRDEVQPKPGACELVHRLNDMGIPMTVATTSESALIESALKRLRIAGCFEGIFSCGDYGTHKREDRIYRIAADSMGSETAETAVFEDALYAVKTAHNGGFFTVAVYDRSSQNDRDLLMSTADLYVNNLSECYNIPFCKGE